MYYLDQIWHKADKTNISREEFDIRLEGILKKDKWIIDGNFTRTLEIRLQECDTVFLLALPLEICIRSAESRIGEKREDLPWIEDEFDDEFRQFIMNFLRIRFLKYIVWWNCIRMKRILLFSKQGMK